MSINGKTSNSFEVYKQLWVTSFFDVLGKANHRYKKLKGKEFDQENGLK